MTLFDEFPIPADEGSTDRDSFQTPPIALEPLLPYLKPFRFIWEPACGEGNLARALSAAGFCTLSTDILDGYDFLTYDPPYAVEAVVTNPPYSLLDEWFTRCYALRKPFALLCPLYTLGGQSRQDMYREYGLEIIMLGRRINFKTPTGKSGKESSAQFETAWFCGNLNIGQALTFYRLPKE